MAGIYDDAVNAGRGLLLGVVTTAVTVAASAEKLFAQKAAPDSVKITTAKTARSSQKISQENTRLMLQAGPGFCGDECSHGHQHHD